MNFRPYRVAAWGITMNLSRWALWLAAVLMSVTAQAGTVTYFHNDLTGSPAVATNAAGQVIWRESYRPYGERTVNDPNSAANKIWFTSRRQDVETGLVYMGARYYEPILGRFISQDPVGFDEANIHSHNRYAYANNNPYRYTDPDGRNPLVFWAIRSTGAGYGAGVMADAASQALAWGTVDWQLAAQSSAAQAGAAAGLFGGLGVGSAPASATAIAAAESAQIAAKEGTEVVQRAMSRAELAAIESSGLLRGGRSGTHYVSNAVNSNAGRAQQRLALPQTPEVRVSLEVPSGRFSPPSRVQPNFNMPGGGMERTASGKVPARVLRVDEY